ncbi:hypothetical protein SFC43_01660 [Bacteroides sp. CR5/BHMF/2]|nr:hypothetical protein [Bacteroides sp. CR5/BHMF/2]
MIVEPTNGTVYYALPTDLEKYNGVTLRIYNPSTRSGSWGTANAYLVYSLGQGNKTFIMLQVYHSLISLGSLRVQYFLFLLGKWW